MRWLPFLVLMACGPPLERRTVGELDVFFTPGAAPRPAVLLLHGGGWSGGSRHEFDFAARRLAGAGYVTATADYRLAPANPFPAAVEDAWCALATLRAQPEVDPSRVAVLGYSAGAHLASMLGTAPEFATCLTPRPVAVISAAGPEDLRLLAQQPPVIDFLGATNAAVASPITHVDSASSPFLLLGGTGDLYVPIEHQVLMQAALHTAGVEVSLLTLEGDGHVLNPSAAGADVQAESSLETAEGWAATVDFLARHLQ